MDGTCQTEPFFLEATGKWQQTSQPGSEIIFTGEVCYVEFSSTGGLYCYFSWSGQSGLWIGKICWLLNTACLVFSSYIIFSKTHAGSWVSLVNKGLEICQVEIVILWSASALYNNATHQSCIFFLFCRNGKYTYTNASTGDRITSNLATQYGFNYLCWALGTHQSCIVSWCCTSCAQKGIYSFQQYFLFVKKKKGYVKGSLK